jgi:GntR family transcriptional regulator, transcriptional repressor for pyruvate dehydrogenase complex
VAKRQLSERAPAYRRVADALRTEIQRGLAPPGHRLESEARLSERFGVSRSSIREALRILASERLIDTTRGSTGGSTVQRIAPRDVADVLRMNIAALVNAEGCTTDEMDEVRELLEVTGAWLAAQRRTPIDLDALRSSIPADPARAPLERQRELNRAFHFRILAATGNRLLHVFGEPLADVIYERFRGRQHDRRYFAQMADDHRAILASIEARDAAAARQAMSEHLLHVRAAGAAGRPRLLLEGLAFDGR